MRGEGKREDYSIRDHEEKHNLQKQRQERQRNILPIFILQSPFHLSFLSSFAVVFIQAEMLTASVLDRNKKFRALLSPALSAKPIFRRNTNMKNSQ